MLPVALPSTPARAREMSYPDPYGTQPVPPASDPWANVETPVYAGQAGTAHQTGYMPVVVERVVFVERPRRRRWPWVLGTLAVLGLACCGIAAALTAPIRAQYPAHVVIGKQVAGLVQDTGVGATVATNALRDQIRSNQHVDSAFAAAFNDPAAPGEHLVLFGATEFIWDPGGIMNGTIQSLSAQGMTNVTAYPAGPMGGVIRCADTVDSSFGTAQPIVLCAWIDHGSIGVGAFYGGRPMADCAAELREIRQVVLVRG
jgi:hypothetical protein